MMYIIPQDLLKKFQAVSAYNFSVNGRHVETLAYLFGHEEDGNLIGTHLVFPQQDGTCSRVDDKGNNPKYLQLKTQVYGFTVETF